MPLRLTGRIPNWIPQCLPVRLMGVRKGQRKNLRKKCERRHHSIVCHAQFLRELDLAFNLLQGKVVPLWITDLRNLEEYKVSISK